jgi:hypothetical protein
MMDGLILEKDLAALGMEKACNRLDDGRFPRPVGADEADHLSPVDLEGNLLYGQNPFISDGDLTD